jgi:hypothetical protein
LYIECATMCSSASAHSPSPHCSSMKPICDTVDQASAVLIALWVSITTAPNSAVNPPSITSAAIAAGAGLDQIGQTDQQHAARIDDAGMQQRRDRASAPPSPRSASHAAERRRFSAPPPERQARWRHGRPAKDPPPRPRPGQRGRRPRGWPPAAAPQPPAPRLPDARPARISSPPGARRAVRGRTARAAQPDADADKRQDQQRRLPACTRTSTAASVASMQP